MQHIHFIGIGGVGMNGLAQLAALAGLSITGSDRAYAQGTQPFRTLEDLGCRLVPQDGTGIHADTARVIYSTAIESDNPDYLKAQELKIPLLHRADFLKELIGDDELIAVAGTAGKTTTTGMLGWIFECLGRDPSVYNGAAVLNWKTKTATGNVRKGNAGLWIIEADESDRSFLRFHPKHSIITNISRDHFELEELEDMFDRFERQTSGFTVRGRSLPETDSLRLAMPGRHNQANARCAYALCMKLGMNPDQVKDALVRFKGIERRLETVGEIDGINVIDDYAHNPAKIAAALDAVSSAYRKVHAYWRPHGFTPLHQNRDELVRIFKETNHASLFILPVYYAGGTVARKTTSEALVAQLNSVGVRARLVQDYEHLKLELRLCARSGDAILGMGARDPELPHFARRLVEEWKTS